MLTLKKDIIQILKICLAAMLLIAFISKGLDMLKTDKLNNSPVAKEFTFEALKK